MVFKSFIKNKKKYSYKNLKNNKQKKLKLTKIISCIHIFIDYFKI